MDQTTVRTADISNTSLPQVGVCGAGVMGTGIAQVFAQAGHAVVLYDAVDGASQRARRHIEADLRKAVVKGRTDEATAESVLGRVGLADDLEGLEGAGLVVEAVTEDLDLKQELFRSLEKLCGEQSLLVTNTSTLSPTQVGSVLADPGRSAGVHFFNPPTRMRLVELIPGQASATTTVDRLRALLTATGKHVVVVNETPGGIVSRLQLLVRNEAIRMASEGVASVEDIDAAMRLGAGWPLGPLELTDLVGLDIHVKNCDSLARELASNRYAPHPLARKLTRAGHLGRKAGQGFYEYDQSTGKMVTGSRGGARA